MIKSISKSDNLLLKIFGKPKQKSSIPQVKKPLVSYMSYLDLEPPKQSDINTGYSLGKLLGDVAKTYLRSKIKNAEAEAKTETVTKVETKVMAETKIESAQQTRASQRYSYDYDYDYSYNEYKEPLVKRIFKTIGNILLYPIEKFRDWRSDFIYEMREKSLKLYEGVNNSSQ